MPAWRDATRRSPSVMCFCLKQATKATTMRILALLSLSAPVLAYLYYTYFACKSLNIDGWTNGEVVVEIHRIGEAQPCGSFKLSVQDLEVFQSADQSGTCHSDLSKYDMEPIMTQLFAKKLGMQSCVNEYDYKPMPGFFGYCDRGKRFTPILPDHDKIVRLLGGTLPCSFYTREGLRITSADQFVKLANRGCESSQSNGDCVARISLQAVSAGRVFMFAPSHVGEKFELGHVEGANGLPLFLEVLNTNPRVFDIHNFFSKEEADAFIRGALAETRNGYKLEPSVTGTDGTTDGTRTSETSFDVNSTLAIKIKKRCMATLGFDEFLEDFTDGLQILRYNATTAYLSHMDYFSPLLDESTHDFDSTYRGGNRFATILLYMTDHSPSEGGETVFPLSWPPNLPESERKELTKALEDLRASGDGSLLEKDSWEEEMAAVCRSKFAIQPRAGRAVLFYSQMPDGSEDYMSRHGGCPVLSKDNPKWAANLWVYNTPCLGSPGSPLKVDSLEYS